MFLCLKRSRSKSMNELVKTGITCVWRNSSGSVISLRSWRVTWRFNSTDNWSYVDWANVWEREREKEKLFANIFFICQLYSTVAFQWTINNRNTISFLSRVWWRRFFRRFLYKITICCCFFLAFETYETFSNTQWSKYHKNECIKWDSKQMPQRPLSSLRREKYLFILLVLNLKSIFTSEKIEY